MDYRMQGGLDYHKDSTSTGEIADLPERMQSVLIKRRFTSAASKAESVMPIGQVIPPMPELGHSEGYYVRLSHDAEKVRDTLAVHAFKVGQYLTLSMDSKLTWEEKLRYIRHTLNKHCVPPQIPDDSVWGFYKDLHGMVRDIAGREALRIASDEDDLYAELTQMGRGRDEIEERAEVFFKRLIPTDECPDWFHEEDYAQIKLIRDQWI
jgi:hypothetical protein